MSSSFKRNVSASSTTSNINAAKRFPAGTRLNNSGNLLLTSTGIPSLDSFLAGGLPIGSLILIGEDPQRTISSSILRCFLSEGIYRKQNICSVDFEHDLTEILPVKEEISDEKSTNEEENLKIAWRYENLSSIENLEKVHFDLKTKKTIPEEMIEKNQMRKIDLKTFESENDGETCRKFVLRKLEEILRNEFSSQSSEKKILRISISSFDSSIFDVDSTKRFDELCFFFYFLRIFLRSSGALCVVTLAEIPRALTNLADFVFDLSLSNVKATEHVGFCRISKLPRLNSIQTVATETRDIGIKFIRHKKHLIFEKFSIPPDLSDDASRDEKNKTVSCSSTSKELDF